MSVWVQQEWYVNYDAQLRATIDSASGLRSVQINVHHRSPTIIIYLFIYINIFVWCTENAVQHQHGSAALHRLPAEGRHAAHGTSLACLGRHSLRTGLTRLRSGRGSRRPTTRGAAASARADATTYAPRRVHHCRILISHRSPFVPSCPRPSSIGTRSTACVRRVPTGKRSTSRSSSSSSRNPVRPTPPRLQAFKPDLCSHHRVSCRVVRRSDAVPVLRLLSAGAGSGQLHHPGLLPLALARACASTSRREPTPQLNQINNTTQLII